MQNKNRLIHTENILTIARWHGGWGHGEKGEGIKKHKLVVTEQSWEYKVQCREQCHIF